MSEEQRSASELRFEAASGPGYGDRPHFLGEGARFDPDEPAEREIRYGTADGDYDDDGEEDPPEAEAEIDLWRQENIGDPWFRVGEIKDEDLDRVRARLTSFSRYALAI